MKTKTIDVWIRYPNDLGGKDDLQSISSYPKVGFTKAKLVIELPEKKITITESEFDKKWKLSLFREGDTKNDFKRSLGF